MHLCASVHMCFVVTCWEEADLLALVCGNLTVSCHFPIGILRQLWYLILSIPDLRTLTYFRAQNTRFHDFVNDESLLKVVCYVVSLFNCRENNANFKHIRAI